MRKDQREREIRHVLGQNVGRIGDAHAPRPRPFEIDCVDADAVAGDDFELRATIDQRAGRAEFPAGRDGARLGHSLGEKRLFVGCKPQFPEVVGLLQGRHVPFRIGADHQHRGLGHASPFPLRLDRSTDRRHYVIDNIGSMQGPPQEMSLDSETMLSITLRESAARKRPMNGLIDRLFGLSGAVVLVDRLLRRHRPRARPRPRQRRGSRRRQRPHAKHSIRRS